jgi:protein-S-isoprenylcysteine O-methyltransferase Ste14
VTQIPGTLQRVLFILLFSLLSAIRLFFKLRYHAINLKPLSKSEGRAAGYIRILLGFPLLFATGITCFAPQFAPFIHLYVPLALSIASFFIGLVVLAGLVSVHIYLGDSFSTSIDGLAAQRRLVTHGPYRYLRHPMYSVYFLLFVAAFGVSGNWVMGLCGTAIIGSLMVLRVPKEERILIGDHGTEYHEYAANTPRFLPSVRKIKWKKANAPSLPAG